MQWAISHKVFTGIVVGVASPLITWWRSIIVPKPIFSGVSLIMFDQYAIEGVLETAPEWRQQVHTSPIFGQPPMNHAAATSAPEQPQLRSSLSADDRQRFGLEGGMLGIKNRILRQCVKEISRRSYVIYYIYHMYI
jgi:hypothetical protein